MKEDKEREQQAIVESLEQGTHQMELGGMLAKQLASMEKTEAHVVSNSGGSGGIQTVGVKQAAGRLGHLGPQTVQRRPLSSYKIAPVINQPQMASW